MKHTLLRQKKETEIKPEVKYRKNGKRQKDKQKK